MEPAKKSIPSSHPKLYIVRPRIISQAHLEFVLRSDDRIWLEDDVKRWLLEGATVEPGAIIAYVRRYKCGSKGHHYRPTGVVLLRRRPRS